MSEQRNPNQPQRRRRKPRRPKWVTNQFTYTLWRNWPLIRFVLVCLLLLSLALSLVTCSARAIGKLFKGDDQPGESTPAVSGPAETTVPPETTAATTAVR